jgi:hypothetical protein
VVDTDDVVLLQRQEDIPLGVIDLRCNGGSGLCGNCTANHYDAQIFTPPYLLREDGTPALRPRQQDGQTVVDTDDVVLLQRQEDIPLGVIDLRCQLDITPSGISSCL